ncbi:MAG: gas vesicle protein K [Acidobacteria bacterium]|nr:gas vesicle protein K [Acidobacteriota bacterium]
MHREPEGSILAGPRVLSDGGPTRPGRLNLPSDGAKNGLAQLVLALVKLLHELLERQAIRRMESGSLTEAQIERLGVALMKQAEELNRLREAFNLDEEDLDIDLGPLGSLS